MSEYQGIEAPAVPPAGQPPAAPPVSGDLAALDDIGPGPGGGVFLAPETEKETEPEKGTVPQGDGRPAGPRLLEAGTYSLYLRPDGNLHISWQRNALGDNDGGILVLAPHETVTRHSRDFPDRMGGLAYLLLMDRETPLPPQAGALLAMLGGDGPPSRAAMLKMAAQLPALLGAMAAAPEDGQP